jgi:integrase
MIYLPLRRLLNTYGKAPAGFIRTRRCWAAESLGVLSFFQERKNSMSIYFQQGKGWRMDFTQNGTRHTEAWFKTKALAKKAEAKRKEEINSPKTETQIDMDFFELLNRRLDFLKAYKTDRYYTDTKYVAIRWSKEWASLNCSDITTAMVQSYLIRRSKISANTANSDLRYLKAVFNYGIKIKLIKDNPAKGIEFFPVDKTEKYVPPPEDVLKVLLVADFDTQDYLCTIKDSMARVGEVNRLKWSDVNFDDRYVVLYTRKKKGGHLTPRRIPMTTKLYDILLRRHKNRDKTKLWVFWHRYWDREKKTWVDAPYKDRKKIMRSLCKKADVKYFRFHALRHAGASLMDNLGVNTGSIQRILGHENRTTTEIYLHSMGESERKAMDIFEQANQSFEEKSHTDSHTEKTKKKRLSGLCS